VVLGPPHLFNPHPLHITPHLRWLDRPPSSSPLRKPFTTLPPSIPDHPSSQLFHAAVSLHPLPITYCTLVIGPYYYGRSVYTLYPRSYVDVRISSNNKLQMYLFLSSTKPYILVFGCSRCTFTVSYTHSLFISFFCSDIGLQLYLLRYRNI